MPSYVSHNGVWEPAIEKVAITDKNGEPVVYHGKDRAALEAIANGDVTSQPFWKDTEFINRVRQVHNMSMDEYMKSHGFDEKTSKEDFEKKLAVVNLHKPLPKKQGKKFRSGGANTAPGGGGSMEGDFGESSDAALAKSRMK
jgi:hypothetical protein